MATAYGTKRSSLDSPAKRCSSPDDTCSPKRRRRHHDEVLHDSVVAAMDVDANSNRGSSRVLRDEHLDRYHSRQRYRHGETSRGRGGSDRWIGSQGVRYDRYHYERWDNRYQRSSNISRDSDSRHTTSDGYERPISCEKVRDVGHKSQRSEEMKGKAFKEEGKEDYQENMFNQLVSKEKGGPIKIEGARTRKISIVVKRFGQHPKQQVESVTSTNSKEVRAIDGDKNETTHLKDSSNVARIQAEENKNDSTQVVSINKAQCTVEQPPARTDGGPTVPTATRKSGKDGSSHAQRNDNPDNWDDAEGHYTYRSGELLNGRYEIAAAHGKGVFSTVVRAKDLQAGKGDPEEVAIKIVRNNDTMNRAGRKEISILEKLAAGADKHHCVRFLSSFRYRNHLCLVFESLDMSLRMALKRFTGNTGFDLSTVRASSKQLFVALKHLKNRKVLHCDIKPENILVDDTKKVIKLCDFGSATLAGTNEVTPYLVSRFYRAPEIVLGLPYDHTLDMWSVGCCLYELYTGKVLFPGPWNNDMLRLQIELKGPFPKKMLRKGAFTNEHFDRDLNFHAIEEDPVTKKVSRRLILNTKPKGIGSMISSDPKEDPKLLSSFKDLLDKIFVLDPAKRITVEQALSHPFITGKFR